MNAYNFTVIFLCFLVTSCSAFEKTDVDLVECQAFPVCADDEVEVLFCEDERFISCEERATCGRSVLCATVPVCEEVNGQTALPFCPEGFDRTRECDPDTDDRCIVLNDCDEPAYCRATSDAACDPTRVCETSIEVPNCEDEDRYIDCRPVTDCGVSTFCADVIACVSIDGDNEFEEGCPAGWEMTDSCDPESSDSCLVLEDCGYPTYCH